MLAITRRPSATTPGMRRELAVEQHELRHRAGRGRARAHGHADVGVLQRERVVHAVAGHRDDVPLRLQRADHRPLLLRRDPPEHRVLPRARRPCSSWSSGSSRASNPPSASGSPTRCRHRGDRARVVARDHLQRDALLVEVGERLGRVGADLLGEHDERRPARARPAAPRPSSAGVAVRQHQRAAPAGGELVGPRPHRRASRR